MLNRPPTASFIRRQILFTVPILILSQLAKGQSPAFGALNTVTAEATAQRREAECRGYAERAGFEPGKNYTVAWTSYDLGEFTPAVRWTFLVSVCDQTQCQQAAGISSYGRQRRWQGRIELPFSSASIGCALKEMTAARGPYWVKVSVTNAGLVQSTERILAEAVLPLTSAPMDSELPVHAPQMNFSLRASVAN